MIGRFALNQHTMNTTNDGVGDADVLAALRRVTASRHEILDSGLALSGEAPTLGDYALHLLLLRNWLAPLQGWLSAFTDVSACLPQAGRLALIDADLRDPSFAGIVALPLPEVADAAWPRDASAAYRLGVCYVIEGSQLGGAVLYQRLHEKLAPHPLRYLQGEPEGPGPRWREFMLALRANVRDEAAIADACAGACAAFDAILAHAFPH
jgi:heme oxygenase (biliverdin-IX-beta and delta-forming)